MLLAASQLRANIYRILDQVLETGMPVEIERHGRKLQIVPVDTPKKLDKLIVRPEFLHCDPEEIVSLDWSTEWRP